MAPLKFSGQEAPPGGFIPDGGSFLNFEVALLYVMAKAWESADFRALLTDVSAQDAAGIRRDDERLRAILRTIRGFNPPWRLRLAIREDPDARWVPGRGWSLPKAHELILNLPRRPAEASHFSLALASYNATGAEFPFTCCP
jgi:ribosomally synthesized peptide (two-chain TOMM family)